MAVCSKSKHMKRTLLSFATTITLLGTVSAQLSGPEVEGVYLPIRGTIVEQVWADGPEVAMDMPAMGENMTWDFVSWFVDSGFTLDTNKFETMLPQAGPIDPNVFDGASHTAMYQAEGEQLDSVFSYFKIENGGLYQVGAYQAKADVLFTLPQPELIMPSSVQFGMDVIHDTSFFVSAPRMIGDTTIEGQNVQDAELSVRIKRYREISVAGHGSLTTPAIEGGITFDDVVMVKEKVIEIQTIRVTGISETGGFSFSFSQDFPGETYYYTNFNFIRQIGAGSDMQMSLQTDSAETEVIMGWYSLPLKVGKICGTVKDSTGDPITDGEVLFYEENELYPKNDLSFTLPVTNGDFCLDSAQYGLFRIAAKANPDSYENSLTTYVGDVTKWSQNEMIRLLEDSIHMGEITIQYGLPSTGMNLFSGNVSTDFEPYAGSSSLKTGGDPIPGLDVSLEQVPGGIVAQTTTDEDANFFFDNINAQPGETYAIHVDVPGLPVTQTHYVDVVSSEDTVGLLNFEVFKDSIVMVPIPLDTTSTNPDSTGSSIFEGELSLNGLSVYPNPMGQLLVFDFSQINADVQPSLIRLISATGQVIFTHRVQNHTVRLNTEHLPIGWYVYEIEGNSGVLARGKLIK